MSTTCGSFTLTEAGDLEWPAEYLSSPAFAALKAKLEAGTSAVVNFGSGDIRGRTLVAVQTDYAAWRGLQQILNMGKSRSRK